MLGEQNETKQQEFFTPLVLHKLIPDDHILKRVDRVLDLRWVRDEVKHLYSETMGRPSVDPEAAIRLMLAGFFHGIVHDRKLMREAQVNLAIRWFAGYRVDERLPDHSTLSKLRKRWGVELFRKIFVRTVSQCTEAGLVDAETVHVDATLIRANASWDSITEKHVENVVRENDEDDDDGGKRGGGRKERVSVTDPDASLTRSSSHDRIQPRYKQHTAVEDRSGVVVDVEVTTGRTPEASELAGQLARVEENTGVRPDVVTADLGYSTGSNFSVLEEKGIEAVIPARRTPKQGKSFTIDEFSYDQKNDIVRCPSGRKLGRATRYKDNGWYYRSRPSDCRNCCLKKLCLPDKQRSRKILIVDGYPSLMRARRRDRRSPAALRPEYLRHKWMVEGRHGEGKTQHGLSRAVRRGLEQVTIQVLLTMAVMNLKRLAAALSALFRAWNPFLKPIEPILSLSLQILFPVPVCPPASPPYT